MKVSEMRMPPYLLFALIVATAVVVSVVPTYAGAKEDAALLIAIDHGDTASALRLLKQGADSNAHDALGRTALMYAGITGQTRAVMKTLLNLGANVNARSSDGTTPLIAASIFGDPEAIRLLLSNHADVNARDENGETVLAWAAGRLRNAPPDRSLFPNMAERNSYGDFTVCTKKEFEETVELLEGAGGRE